MHACARVERWEAKGRRQELRIIECYNGEQVQIDDEFYEWASSESWKWDKNGAYRNEARSDVFDRLGKRYDPKVYLQWDVMLDRISEAPDEIPRSLPAGLRVGFVDRDKANCSSGNLFLYREGWQKLGRARVLGGACGQETHLPCDPLSYETLGCVCGTKTRVAVWSRKCRCCKCRRRLSDDSL